MTLTEHYKTRFEEGKFYHVYNRTVDRQPMFRNEGNYVYFLKKYDEYLSPVLDTYAYCLLGNHFHFLISVQQDLTTFKKLSNLPLEKASHEIVSHQWRKFFQSYAMAFNKQHNRVGTLFQTPFKRAQVANKHYFAQLVYYIHKNPQTHGLIDDHRKWVWSSYERILIDTPSKLKKDEVIKWFSDRKGYQQFHSADHKINQHEEFILEDDW